MSKKGGYFQVERILGHYKSKGTDYYLVHWLGYSSKEDSWEPVDNLSTCEELIQSFMEQKAAVERRKSLRSRPTPTRDSILLSSDDEGTITGPTTRKSIRSQKATTKTVRGYVSPRKSTSTDITSKYNLRSVHGDFSSEDELEVSKASKKTTRMSLSESRFRKQLNDIKKGKYTPSPRKTSTPQKPESPQQPESAAVSNKVQAKTKLLFDNSQSTAASDRRSSIVTRQQRRQMEEEITVAEQPPMVAEADNSEIDHSPPRKSHNAAPQSSPVADKTPPVKETEEERCFPVTWKEFALAAFVTGVAAVGYVCYTTDYCGYC